MARLCRLLLLLGRWLALGGAFNLDVDRPAVYSGSEGSYFGFAVDFFAPDASSYVSGAGVRTLLAGCCSLGPRWRLQGRVSPQGGCGPWWSGASKCEQSGRG